MIETAQRTKPLLRQLAPTIEGIRTDHVYRYKNAVKRMTSPKIVGDFACGCGYGSSIIADAFPKAIIMAADISHSAIEYANDNYSRDNVEYIQTSLEDLTFPEGILSVITSFETVEHVEDDVGLLAKYRKLLALGGELFLSVPNQLIIPHNPSIHPQHFRHYCPDEIKQKLNDAGFEIVKQYYQDVSGRFNYINGMFIVIDAKVIN